MTNDGGLRLDVPSIDFEHGLQIDLVEALGRQVAEGKSREVAEEILEKLLDLTQVHFLGEELMMRMEGYPGYEAHLAELLKLKTVHRESPHPMTQAAVDGLRSWLAGHIRTQDRAFAAFLASRVAGRAGV